MNNDDAGERYAPVPAEFTESDPPTIASDEEQPGFDGPARVVGLGAVCDLDRESDDGRSTHFAVSEFALLEGGRHVILRGDLGFTIGWGSGVSGMPAVWKTVTVESITRDVLNVVLPDDDDGEDHPWDWLAELARDRGLSVTADELRILPYGVELTNRVLRLISAT